MNKMFGALLERSVGDKTPPKGKEVINVKFDLPTDTLLMRMTKKRLYQMRKYWDERP